MRHIKIALSVIVAMLCFSGTVFAGSAHFIFDARAGKVLASENADVLNHPASLTKMMTLYMTFEAIKQGKISWDSPVKFSRHASARPPTKLWVKPGRSITVREAVYGMIVVSANDAAAAMAEKLGGTESNFAAMMTRRARQLGMARTTFVNASGLPDKRQITTARDMATLGVVLLRDFPKEYKLFSMQSFNFGGKRIRGHNNLMYRYDGMDGIKTGYTNASGFNLVSAVRIGDRRVIGVVLGGKTARSRDNTMQALLDRTVGRAAAGSSLVAAGVPAPGPTVVALDAVPVPSAAPRSDEVVAELEPAAAGAAPPAAAPAPAPATTGSIPVPIPASRYETAYVEPGARMTASMATEQILRAPDGADATNTSEGGWQIQIAAADSREAALNLLARAQAKVGSVLAGSQPYTEPVSNGGATLYRARFVGFASKEEARDACDGLTKKSYDCLMMPGRS